MPKVSVVIPLYQSEPYIAETVRSVLNQTLRDIEVFVINDGSTDRGPDIVRSFGDARVQVISQANRGLAGARNSGIRLCQSPYIALVDADDIWHPLFLQRHVANLDVQPHAGVSFSASRLIDERGKPLGLEQRPPSVALDAPRIFYRSPVGNVSNVLMRKATLDDIAYHDPAFGRTLWFDENFRQTEDVELWTRIAVTTSWRFSYVSEVLSDYRIHNGGLSANTDAQLASWLRFRAKVKAYAPDFERAWGNKAEGFFRRYLARRLVRQNKPGAAMRFLGQALWLCPSLAIEDPVRTLSTLVAACVRGLVRGRAFSLFERAALGLKAALPGLRL